MLPKDLKIEETNLEKTREWARIAVTYKGCKIRFWYMDTNYKQHKMDKDFDAGCISYMFFPENKFLPYSIKQGLDEKGDIRLYFTTEYNGACTVEGVRQIISDMEEGLEMYRISQEIFDMYFPGVLCKKEPIIEADV